jgi:hypothetical protein
LEFTLECEVNGKLPFLGMEAISKDGHLETKVYVKPPILVSFSITKVMWIEGRRGPDNDHTVLRAFHLSSSWKYFVEEWDMVKEIVYHL